MNVISHKKLRNGKTQAADPEGQGRTNRCAGVEGLHQSDLVIDLGHLCHNAQGFALIVLFHVLYQLVVHVYHALEKVFFVTIHDRIAVRDGRYVVSDLQCTNTVIKWKNFT